MFYVMIPTYNVSLLAGTVRISNSTMETYSQGTSANILDTSGPQAGLNCFSCHDSGLQSVVNEDLYELPSPNAINLAHNFLGQTHAIRN